MSLTKLQKILAYGLTRFPIPEEDQEAIFLILAEDETKTQQMILFLAQNEAATEEEILMELSRITE